MKKQITKNHSKGNASCRLKRFAAFIVAVVMNAVQTAQAANYFWIGNSNDGNFNAKANWIVYKNNDSGTAASNPPTTYYSNGNNNAFFFPTCYPYTGYNSKFVNGGYVVTFYGAVTNTAKVLFKNTGTAASPIIFRASNGRSYAGLTVDNATTGTGWCFSDSGGDSHVKFEFGTYAASGGGAWYVGGDAYAGHITVCEGATIASANDFDFKNGTVDVSGSLTAKSIKIGNLSGGTATMTVSGGTVVNTSGAAYIGYVSGATGALYLNDGGTLVTRNVYKQEAGATGTLVFNGGTLKASDVYANYGGLIGTTVTAKVGDNGGTIDTGNLNITLGTPISDVDGEAGGMTVKGGGSLTVLVAQGYTGGTTVEAGTALNLTTAAKESLVAHAVVVSVPDGGVADNAVVLHITDSGTFMPAEVNAMTLSGIAGPCYTLGLANSDKDVVLRAKAAATGDGNWIGGTDDGWATASNWQNGIIPTAATRNAFFIDSNFNDRFTANGKSVLFDGKRVNTYKVHVRNAGSENAPVVFRATSAENGLMVNATSSNANTGYLIGFDTGDGWLKLESGTYGTSNKGGWYVGGANYAGHITVCEGATVVSANDFDFRNGTVDVEGTLTAKQVKIGTASGKTATMTVSGGTVVNTSGAAYIGYVSEATGALYLNEGGTLVTRNVYTDGGTGTLVFNGGTLKANASYYFAQYGGLIGSTNVLSAVVESNGGTIDNGGFAIHITKTMTGSGGIQLAGSGTTEITANQSYAGTTTVKSGTTISAAGVTFAGSVAFEAGSAVAVPEIPEGKSSVNILTAAGITGVENLPGPDESGNGFFLKNGNCLAWGKPSGLVIMIH